MALWTYYHSLSPFIFKITGNIGLRWYSLAYIAAALFCYFFAKREIEKGRLQFPLADLMDAVTYGAIGVIVGGRLGYCIFYSPYLLWDFNSSFPFWGLLKVYEGGMSSHGGVLGLLASLWIYTKVRGAPFFPLMDVCALGGSVGFFLGRSANFINGELFGHVIKGKALLGVRFPQELFLWGHYVEKHQDALLSLKKALPALRQFQGESAFAPGPSLWADWVSMSLQNPVYRQKTAAVAGQLFAASQEGFEPVRAVLETLLPLRHPSQLYQAFFGGFITFIIIYFLWRTNRLKPGLIALIWAGLYLSFRILTEIFRLPDAFLGYRYAGLTQGQILSLASFAVVIVYGFFLYRSKPRGFRKTAVF